MSSPSSGRAPVCANCVKPKDWHTQEGDAWYCWPRSQFPTMDSLGTGRYLETFTPAIAPLGTPPLAELARLNEHYVPTASAPPRTEAPETMT